MREILQFLKNWNNIEWNKMNFDKIKNLIPTYLKRLETVICANNNNNNNMEIMKKSIIV